MSRVALAALLVATTVIIIALSIYLPRLLVSSDQKYKVAMAGRSVTEQWFRRRSLPSVLNKISIWREWPIPYDKYSDDEVYYERIKLPSPTKNREKTGYVYGGESYKAIEDKLNHDKYDVLMFKFCFVDFDDGRIKNSHDVQSRLNEMTGLTKKIHGLARTRGIKLVLGNAMPSLAPSQYGQSLRREYNQWLNDYASHKMDVVILDLFGSLVDDHGKLRKEYSFDLSDNDSHLNEVADKLYGESLNKAIGQVRQ